MQSEDNNFRLKDFWKRCKHTDRWWPSNENECEMCIRCAAHPSHTRYEINFSICTYAMFLFWHCLFTLLSKCKTVITHIFDVEWPAKDAVHSVLLVHTHCTVATSHQIYGQTCRISRAWLLLTHNTQLPLVWWWSLSCARTLRKSTVYTICEHTTQHLKLLFTCTKLI